jgi:hypothetical protein
MARFTKGTPKPPNSGRRKGQANRATERERRLLALVDANDSAINAHVIELARGGSAVHQTVYYRFLRPPGPRPKVNPTPTVASEPKTIEDVRKATAELLVKLLAGELDIDAANAAAAMLKTISDQIVGTDLQQAVDELKARNGK